MTSYGEQPRKVLPKQHSTGAQEKSRVIKAEKKVSYLSISSIKNFNIILFLKIILSYNSGFRDKRYSKGG
jgi:hypothetical protein